MKLFKLTALLPMAFSFGLLAQNLTDAEIAKIVENTNKGEIELAKLAKERSDNEEVKKFADHMITDHMDNNKKSARIVEKNNVKPEENPKSREMKVSSEASKKMLETLKGEKFDKAYITDQIATHQKVLETIENTLLPAAKNEELKSHLMATKTKVEGHLRHAKQIRENM